MEISTKRGQLDEQAVKRIIRRYLEEQFPDLESRCRPQPWRSSEYAEFRGITPEAAAQERFKGNGPVFIRANGRIYYDPRDVWAWLESCKRTRTGEAA